MDVVVLVFVVGVVGAEKDEEVEKELTARAEMEVEKV
jgi:hypothetical protein